jgi:hypothetical protein
MDEKEKTIVSQHHIQNLNINDNNNNNIDNPNNTENNENSSNSAANVVITTQTELASVNQSSASLQLNPAYTKCLFHVPYAALKKSDLSVGSSKILNEMNSTCNVAIKCNSDTEESNQNANETYRIELNDESQQDEKEKLLNNPSSK